MAMVRIADMFAHVITELDKARSALTNAALWARSDWSDQRALTDEEAEARSAVFGTVQLGKDAIDDLKGQIDWAQRNQTRMRRRRREASHGR